MKKIHFILPFTIVIVLLSFVVLLLGSVFFGRAAYSVFFQKNHPFQVQSIDTMKYSRDAAREALNDPSFDTTINAQMQLIEDAGATHVAIATPYDEEFVPILKRWVTSAREHHLSVWFRGNFSGWEGWFDYGSIGRTEHVQLLTAFIRTHSDLFADGDLFSPCPECENGGAGDPRNTGDATGYNNFLITEYQTANREFKNIGKSVTVYSSMNGDIAREIITPATAHALGGTILIDHYVDSTEKFSNDVSAIASSLTANVGLGEMGAPIPDLNGNMTDSEQASYVRAMLTALYGKNKIVPLVNYWDLSGGSTALINDNGTPRSAYYVVKDFFSAPYVYGNVFNSAGEPLNNATILVKDSPYVTVSKAGSYQIFLFDSHKTLVIAQAGYLPKTITVTGNASTSMRQAIYLEPANPSIWYSLRRFFYLESLHLL